MCERTCQLITKLSFESQQKNSILPRNSVSVSKLWQIMPWRLEALFRMRFYVSGEKIRSWKALTKTDFWHFRTFVVFENIYDPSKWWTFCSIESLTTRVIIWQIIAHQMTVNDQNWLFLVIHTVHGRTDPNQDSNRTMVLSFLTLNESFLVKARKIF